MRIFFWILVASIGAVYGTTNKSSGVVKVDLVFSRNETYAPTDLLPLVFGFQNTELVPFLGLTLHYEIWDWNNFSETIDSRIVELRWANYSSSDAFFEATYTTRLEREGTWMLKWTLG
jgi:hypothetical protein